MNRTDCLMVALNGPLSKSGPAVDDDGGLLLTITSPDKTPYDATFAEATAGRSVLFLGTEVFLAWGPTLVSGSQYAHIPDPSGGTTVDAEARAAIEAILLVLEGKGLVAGS